MCTRKTLLTLFLFSFLLGGLFAQTNSQYSVRFLLNSEDCGANVVTVDIELKVDAGYPGFNVAEQNYRFSFDDNVVTNPRIQEELEISGDLFDNGTYYAFFDDHNLYGSLDTIISYNVVLTGGTGYPIDDTRWYPVGRIAFDLVDGDECLELKWHSHAPEDFPPTFVSEKFGGQSGSLYEIEEGSYDKFNFCDITCMPTATEELPRNSLTQNASIFPNPASGDQVTLEFYAENSSQQAQVFLLDELGQIIQRSGTVLRTGKNALEVKTKNLAAGIYFIQVKSDENQSITKKFVKISAD